VIVLREGRVLIQDLKSRNGTFVNDKRLPTDKAKLLRDGDHLRIGKLEFQLSIEHGLQAAKKPEVADIGDAAARTVQAGDSKFEEVDVTSWLDEADQIDRVRKLSDPETRQFQFDHAEQKSDDDSDSSELSVTETGEQDSGKAPATDRKKKREPGRLPEHLKRAMSETSRDAADDALRRFFSGQ
jgi:predicted component of type VI protein secretion system